MAIVELVPDPSPGPSGGPSTGGGRRRYRLSNPATGAPLREFDAATAEDVAAAITRARAAQPAWAALPVAQRAAFMQEALRLLLERQEAIIDLLVSETGRSRFETLMMEIFPACDALNYWSRNAARQLKDERVGLHLLRHKSARIHYRPMGVVGVITPWNGPFILSLNPTVQALLAGNAVIVKPSEVTPFSAKMVETLLRDAGVPEGVVQVIPGDGATGAALCEGGVNRVSFTGSVATGRRVGEACGRNLIPCTLELGGKDPMIVCADADLERAAGGALFGGIMNNGQFCSSTERIYVVESVADAFTEKLVAKTRALKLAKEGEYDVGPFIFPRQLEVVDRHVREAVAAGARVHCGGERRPDVGPLYYAPTVIDRVTGDMALMHEETFGPILPIVRVKDEAEAIREANTTAFGLGATVWTRDKARGIEIARQLRAGAVVVNDSSITYGILDVPFGGVGESGVGSVNGRNGIRNYCHAQPIIVDRFGLAAEEVWYPYTLKKHEGLQGALRWLWGSVLRVLLA